MRLAAIVVSGLMVGLVAVLSSACGGAAKSAAPAEAAPATGGAPAGASNGQPGYPAATPTPTAQTEQQPGQSPSREAVLGAARGELEEASRALDVAAQDCKSACLALGSMDRAAGHLCAMAQVDDERTRCEDAKAKVRSARDKVRTTCGSCPMGATVDRNAPIPSPR